MAEYKAYQYFSDLEATASNETPTKSIVDGLKKKYDWDQIRRELEAEEERERQKREERNAYQGAVEINGNFVFNFDPRYASPDVYQIPFRLTPAQQYAVAQEDEAEDVKFE